MRISAYDFHLLSDCNLKVIHEKLIFHTCVIQQLLQKTCI